MVDYNNPALTVELQIETGDWAVGSALEAVRDFITCAHCGPDAEARLCIVVEELVANLVEHGNAPPESEIVLKLAAIGADIALTLSDQGVPFDIRTAGIPDTIPPDRGGGAGIALVLSWAHVIDYVQVDGRNVLTLVISNNV